ncbi:LSU ribosomal protein L23p (L23Ae) [hydrothermal vent metagenome]|uniref:LSU ribosomal protein L23p (L23Ae) n=1 Tax=hydrothermal vent metagenome TaxID=652676 RepID=A0A3B0Y2T1_9ZZZZ
MMSQERILQVLVAPHISEKSTLLADASAIHVFKVNTSATKLEIKQAVEELFEVKVAQVRVMNVKGKTKRFGQRIGKRSDWRKAYVKLAEGQDIALAGAN